MIRVVLWTLALVLVAGACVVVWQLAAIATGWMA